MLPHVGPLEILLIILVILLLFGASRIPKLMRSLGRGIQEFKEGARGEGSEADDDDK
jgi:sec-independent protein translocase protein TatA